LADDFLREFNAQHNKNLHLTSKVAAILLEYPWPGNVRELRNIIERLVVTAETDEIKPGDLPPEVRFFSQRPAFDLESATREAERKAILAALETAGHHRERAAELLGVSVRTLHYKLKKLGFI
ncbi:MAG TPA: helix-turn-helix domain-containing protein, partial [Planctomycetota bacterium]|nr:helix-turn-helix domain-containing protein [Planctomycetota bacterium]